MKYILVRLACLGITSFSYGRDIGYAIQCIPIESGPALVIFFLEDGTNKRVRFLETATGAMWDNHEWIDRTVTISSFSQAKGESQPSLISYIEVDTELMSAKQFRANSLDRAVSLQCERWSPRTRNK